MPHILLFNKCAIFINTVSGLVPADRNVDGVVDMLLDATQNYYQPLSKERLFAWHNALFPAGMSGLYKILVGQWRDDSTGPMQVVSGAIGREKIHYQAPNAAVLPQEMQLFLEWFNTENAHTEPLIKAGIAHLWFVTLHPFEDGKRTYGSISKKHPIFLVIRFMVLQIRFITPH